MIRQGELVEIDIEDVSSDGNGVGKIDSQVIFIPHTVTGDRIQAKLIKVKKKYAQGRLEKIINPSNHRIRPRCIVADKCGGCKWQHIDYQHQLEIKKNQVKETLTRIGDFTNFEVEDILADTDLGYRNKASYPFGVSQNGNLKAGYYREGSHQIVNLNQCPIQDERLNPLLAEIKQDLQELGIPVYDENTKKGILRHLCFRIGKNTGEILITIVISKPSNFKLAEQAPIWLERYPNVVGVTLNYNPKPTNVIFGEETELLAGRLYLKEEFAGLTFTLRTETFFQVNTTVAESLFKWVIDALNLQGNETVIDLYCGIGALTLPIAQKVDSVMGIEFDKVAIELANHNAVINDIDNVRFVVGKAEVVFPELTTIADIVILDPPRKGCQPEVIESLGKMKPQKIVYVSCHPATLARDLKLLCENNDYVIERVKPADFFPQTTHVETAVILTRR
ncbi:23S rRNA (uracil(1939)-C(5))-methyltransferase RlmD [Cyanobacterium stanieri LEGE 03274]|uniref:23S rRNA (Uracil(1939)-C(5))-methyltransferase RlmD n=1 Tax=Cyanobacterium stanieri LEGE 03274 TaxID=1828756 RepID=A0ABR9V421_9CHRO|nr:23S rRNA (uracil(1939)-C(5))-methyltransferase RlmD [Cyanobacterium stanieri]MBE9222635.1 23S rRNA (uracil(1939)-C(5))-methyltransferase RlmD [Cyanobacterium stanieri LEGE 03274]